ncbi:MAG TPA: AAA family ATPase [Candidatus Omnitrophota bacterium]|jgi:chromosome partitioning protein|nr:AAA family ATPase [Candidatus Omnitrophota bacterium]HSA30364.1 AAA family ATPase [Candidatus Omnitrophota bacterium]
MAKIISVCNQKGGTGKTTTAVNLSYALSQAGFRVLLVDTDPQGNATSGVGVNKNVLEKSVYDILLNKSSAEEALIKGVFKNLDIVPCNIDLTGAEIELVGALSRETRLKKALKTISDHYDFIFIDSPPSLGLLTLNALVASNAIIVPIQCEFYALEGVSQLLNTLNLIKEGLNPELAIEGVLLTMADYRTNLTNEVINEIKSFFKEKVYNSVIPRNIKLSEAPSFGKPIMLYHGASIGAKKYLELAQEFLSRNGIFCKTLELNNLQENSNGASAEDMAEPTE